MLVSTAVGLRRCALTSKPNVGAGLPAMAVYQSLEMLTDPLLSQASQLLQGFVALVLFRHELLAAFQD